ncbi:MAG: MAC/perforin domain-containing protein [Pseudomonadota bacterium]
MRAAFLALAAASMSASTMLTPLEPVAAQIPAFLPTKDSVPAGEVMEIDGDWRVNTINKVIRIEAGRAFAVEGWTHAFVLRVQPDMVTIRNIRQLDDTTYVGDDLPMMGQVTMKLVSRDRIEASVPGLFGPARYTLTRVASAVPNSASEETFPDIPPEAARDLAAEPAPARQSFVSLEQAFGEPRPIAQAFRGCVIPEAAKQGFSAAAPEPPSSTPRDRVTNRQFAPVALADPTDTAEEADACWTRLDGVWAENSGPVFDTAQNDGSGWGTSDNLLSRLLHGNYTTPETLFIVPGDDPKQDLYIMSGVGDVRFTRFVAQDEADIASLIGEVGARKTYRAETRTALGGELVLDYTAGGTLRIRLGNRQFQRPPALKPNELSMDDVFAIQFQTDNFAANLKGYNVLEQDPFLLMDNPNAEIFARRSNNEYSIQEKFAVPFGFVLRNELSQGNLYRQQVLSSGREMQNATTTSFGANATLSISGAVNSALAFIPGTGQVADTGASVGYKATQSTMQQMRESRSVGQVVGYSRAKNYAIIVDPANTKLSADFLTAVGDAQNEGRYDTLIERFGTHYAYAVTYGASAKMWRDVRSEDFAEVLGETNGDRTEGEVRYLGSSVGGFQESLNSGLNGSSGSMTDERGYFYAVGGNGSYDSSSFARGDRLAPILLDLRPIDELLNPINFPDQPDVYTRVRAELALAVNRYLASRQRFLSSDRPIERITMKTPPPEPEPEVDEGPVIEEWHVYVRHLNCRKVGIGTTNRVSGTMRITSTGGARNGFAQAKELAVGCEKGDNGKRETFSYSRREDKPGLMILRGTREELKRYDLKFDFNWRYGGVTNGKSRNSSRTLTSTPLQINGLEPGESDTTSWTVSPNRRPVVKLYLRVKRIK